MVNARKASSRLCRLSASLGGLLLALTGCGDGLFDRFLLKPDDIIVERQPDTRYEALFPYYVDLCSISQWRDKLGRQGNPFGHALIYIKGACKDEAAPFPALTWCSTAISPWASA
jgi:hypothetical protein